jgi:acid phosphatase type 7
MGSTENVLSYLRRYTGGVKHPAILQLVADAMEADARKNTANGEVAFFYHLGDVVYYNGQATPLWSSWTSPPSGTLV